jgi:hypothetical protein
MRYPGFIHYVWVFTREVNNYYSCTIYQLKYVLYKRCILPDEVSPSEFGNPP